MWPVLQLSCKQHVVYAECMQSVSRCVFGCRLKVLVFVSFWRVNGRWLHAFSPAYEKLRSLNSHFNDGSSYRNLLADLTSAIGQICGCRHNVRQVKQDHIQCTPECISSHNLNVERNLTGSQCRPRSTGVMCSSASTSLTTDESGGRILDMLQWIDGRL